MKKTLTLLAAGALAATSLSAQAQVAVDGVLNTAELTTGNYVLIGKFTQTRGFGDAGLLSLYAASTATKVYLFLGGTVEANGNSLQIYLKTPASAGVPKGTALPGTGMSGTSFDAMTAKMDMAVNTAIAIRYTTGYVVEGATYTSATAGTAAVLTGTANPGDGTVSTLAVNTAQPAFAGARVAYKAATGGKLSANPGLTATTTDPNYGGVGSYGLEIEMDRTAAGLTGASALTLFAIQNNNTGGYLSSDFIPQSSTATGNLTTASAVDFSTIAGLQAATVNFTAAGGTTLGSRATDAAAMALSVFPNPVADNARIAYTVTEQASPVNIVLTDLLGRTLNVLENGVKPVGSQSAALSKAALPAGTYLVRVQVGEKVSTSKVVVL
ncbi:MAG: T9SS type A sorting domain-containing protein [Cytophagaceae bacterium]|nr:MAG: T9SS type A sorting domain-containing protein [Cytophagaceae bacterium]